MEPKPSDQNHDTPGAPELPGKVKIPSAPLFDEPDREPVFKATPTARSAQVPDVADEPADQSASESDEQADATPDDHQARLDYLRSLRQQESKHRGKRKGHRGVWISLLIIVVLAAAGGGYYYFWQRPASQPTPQTAATKPTELAPKTTAPTDEQLTPDNTQLYRSSVFNLTLRYPAGWQTAELADQFTVTSPVVSLTDAAGSATKGRIVMTVRQQQKQPPEFKGGKVVAVLESTKLQYTKPSGRQRAETYLSYLQYAATTTKGGLDGIYITGDYGYKYGQVMPLTDVAKLSPLIDVTFVSCADDACAPKAQQPLTLSSSAWQQDTTNRPTVEALLKSITII